VELKYGRQILPEIVKIYIKLTQKLENANYSEAK